MNFRRILLTGAALGSAAALTAACSNSDDVVLTIPTTDSAVSGNNAGPGSESGNKDSDDGRFIARCSTEADGDGFAGQTFFTDGSSDFSDYCLQRFYSGVQPAPGAVYVPREDREDSDRESGSNERGSDSERQTTQPQQVPTEGQVLAEGQNNRNQNISDGGTGGQRNSDQPRAGVGGEQNQAADNFGAANAGSPTRPGDGNQGGNNNGGNNNQGNQGGNNENPGRGQDDNEGQGGSQPPTTTPGQNDNGDNDTTVPGLPGVTLPPTTSPTTPETPQTTQPQTPETTGQGQTTPSTPQTGQTQAPSQTQSPEGTGSTQEPTPTETADTGAGTGAVEDTASPSGALSGSSLPAFPQFPPLQVPAVGEVFDGISS